MSNVRSKRSILAVMTEILTLTRKMAASRDADFLVSAIDDRERLIDEYKHLKADPGAADAFERDKPEIDKMTGEIAELNKTIGATLNSLLAEAKLELESSVSRNKVLNYTNNAISSSGSYMDYKK